MHISSKSLRIASIAVALAMLAGVSAGAATAGVQHPRHAALHHRLTAQTHAKQKLHHRRTAHAQARDLHKQDRSQRHEKSLKTSENGGPAMGGSQRPSTPQENAKSGAAAK